MNQLTRRIRTFVFRGLVTAAVFSLPWAPFLLAAGNRPLPRFGVGAFTIIAVYLMAGAVGGLLFALAYPLKRSFWGGFFLGTLALVPAYVGLALILDQEAPLIARLTIGLLLGTLVGGGVSVWEWAETTPANARPRRSSVVFMWIGVALCMIVGFILGARWRGEWPAAVGLALVFLPLLGAVLATFSWSHRKEPVSMVASLSSPDENAAA